MRRQQPQPVGSRQQRTLKGNHLQRWRMILINLRSKYRLSRRTVVIALFFCSIYHSISLFVHLDILATWTCDPQVHRPPTRFQQRLQQALPRFNHRSQLLNTLLLQLIFLLNNTNNNNSRSGPLLPINIHQWFPLQLCRPSASRCRILHHHHRNSSNSISNIFSQFLHPCSVIINSNSNSSNLRINSIPRWALIPTLRIPSPLHLPRSQQFNNQPEHHQPLTIIMVTMAVDMDTATIMVLVTGIVTTIDCCFLIWRGKNPSYFFSSLTWVQCTLIRLLFLFFILSESSSFNSSVSLSLFLILLRARVPSVTKTSCSPLGLSCRSHLVVFIVILIIVIEENK